MRVIAICTDIQQLQQDKQDMACKNYIITMKQGQDSEKSQDHFALISQEFDLVVEGKSADRLVKLLRDFQIDPFSSRIEKVEGALQKYALGLLINGQYIDLAFLLQRHKGQVEKQIKGHDILLKIGEAGRREDLKQLWEHIRFFIGQNSARAALAQRVKEGTIDFTVRLLSKYYLNFSLEDLNTLTGLTEQEVSERGVEVRGKFIQLREEKVQSDCLQNKLKELAVVASKMSQFE